MDGGVVVAVGNFTLGYRDMKENWNKRRIGERAMGVGDTCDIDTIDSSASMAPWLLIVLWMWRRAA
ncbi:unnamed protein product, partial [Ilex paraguariensis]